jgi:uncharacterized membrane protein
LKNLIPVFFVVFFGPALTCATLVVLSVIGWTQPGALYVLAGSLLHLLGSILVTILFNVPGMTG